MIELDDCGKYIDVIDDDGYYYRTRVNRPLIPVKVIMVIKASGHTLAIFEDKSKRNTKKQGEAIKLFMEAYGK